MTSIRRATRSDLDAITAIYNEAILTTTATFDLEPKTLEERRQWLVEHDDRHPVLVAELDGQIVGWACLSHWRLRRAYDDTAETSFYVRGCPITIRRVFWAFSIASTRDLDQGIQRNRNSRVASKALVALVNPVFYCLLFSDSL